MGYIFGPGRPGDPPPDLVKYPQPKGFVKYPPPFLIQRWREGEWLMVIGFCLWCLTAFLSGAAFIAAAVVSVVIGEWYIGIMLVPLGLMVWFGSWAMMN